MPKKAPKLPTLPTQITGNIGMYYACYRLSLLGWNVMPTARNAKGIDIIAYREDTTNFLGIQVKCLSRRNTVRLGNSLDKITGDCWVIVNNINNARVTYKVAPNSYLLLPDTIKQHGFTSIDKRGDYSMGPHKYAVPEYEEKWGLLDDLLEQKRNQRANNYG